MRKMLKQILLGLPLFLGLLIATDVKAVDVCGSNMQATTRNVTVKNTYVEFEVPGVHDRANFYIFSLDKFPALCLDPGKSLHSGTFYLKSNSPITNEYIKKAYAYAKKYSDTGRRLVAQIVTWAARQNYTDFSLQVQQGFKNYAQKYRGVSESDALVYLAELLAEDTSGINLYIWEKPNNVTEQNLVSEYGGSDVPCKDYCSLEVVNNLATCTGNGNSNFGTAYQQAVGNCTQEHNSSAPKTNYYGDYKESFGSYCGLYCLESVTEEFPGNIKMAAKVGTYIVWPNNNININMSKKEANLDVYPLKLQFKKTCKILVDSNAIMNDYATFSYIDADNKKQSLDTYKIIGSNDYNKYRTEAINKNCSDTNSKYNTCTQKPGRYMSNGVDYGDDSTCNGTANNPGVACVYSTPDCSTEKKALNSCKAYKAAYDHANSVINDFNSCITKDLSGYTYGNIDVSITSKYNDPTYGKTNFDLQKSSSIPGCDGCTSSVSKLDNFNPANYSKTSLSNLISRKKDEVETRNIVISTTDTYDLKDGYYYYADKINNKSVHHMTGDIKNYSTIGFSNMPISFKANTGTSNASYYYNLKLDIDVKSENPFKEALKNQNYTCKYKTTKDDNTDCECPDGTINKGKDVFCKIKAYNEEHEEQITCADGQHKWCDAGSTTEEDWVCIPEDDMRVPTFECPPNTKEYKTGYMKRCLSSGEGWIKCIEGCDDNPTGNLTCPDDPEGETSMTEELRACVQVKMNQGMNQETAKEACLALGICEDSSSCDPGDPECPSPIGNRIIYRTISLANPFPSHDADSNVTQTGLNKGTHNAKGIFNDTVKGRYPGSNWNSEDIVYNVIRNNRSVDGDKVYEKNPLYTFVLDSKTIKSIRNYNNKNKYSDFNLNCLKDHSSACVSENFVHNTKYGLQKQNSTCGGKLTKDNFYTCADKTGSTGNPVVG